MSQACFCCDDDVSAQASLCKNVITLRKSKRHGSSTESESSTSNTEKQDKKNAVTTKVSEIKTNKYRKGKLDTANHYLMESEVLVKDEKGSPQGCLGWSSVDVAGKNIWIPWHARASAPMAIHHNTRRTLSQETKIKCLLSQCRAKRTDKARRLVPTSRLSRAGKRVFLALGALPRLRDRLRVKVD